MPERTILERIVEHGRTFRTAFISMSQLCLNVQDILQKQARNEFIFVTRYMLSKTSTPFNTVKRTNLDARFASPKDILNQVQINTTYWYTQTDSSVICQYKYIQYIFTALKKDWMSPLDSSTMPHASKAERLTFTCSQDRFERQENWFKTSFY